MVYDPFAIVGNVDSSSDTDSEHGGYTAGEEWSHTDQSEWDERGDAMFWWDSYFTYNAHEVNDAVVLDADNDSTCTNDTEKGRNGSITVGGRWAAAVSVLAQSRVAETHHVRDGKVRSTNRCSYVSEIIPEQKVANRCGSCKQSKSASLTEQMT